MMISWKNAAGHGVNTPYEILLNSAATQPAGRVRNEIRHDKEDRRQPLLYGYSFCFRPSSARLNAGSLAKMRRLPG